jgi:hypothetical protein
MSATTTPARRNTTPTPVAISATRRNKALWALTARKFSRMCSRAVLASRRCVSASPAQAAGSSLSRKLSASTSSMLTGYATRRAITAAAPRPTRATTRSVRVASGSPALRAEIPASEPITPALARTDRARCSNERFDSRSTSSCSAIRAAAGSPPMTDRPSRACRGLFPPSRTASLQAVAVEAEGVLRVPVVPAGLALRPTLKLLPSSGSADVAQRTSPLTNPSGEGPGLGTDWVHRTCLMRR